MNQRNTTAGEEITVDDWRNSVWLFWLWVGLPQLGTATLGQPKKHAIGSASTDRSSYD